MERAVRPFSLLDTDLQGGLSPRDWYGAGHTPSLPTDLAERLSAYKAATTYLQGAFAKYDGLHVLTALSLLRLSWGRREQCQTDIIEAEVELAQALFLKYGGGRDIPTAAAIKEIKQSLKVHMLLCGVPIGPVRTHDAAVQTIPMVHHHCDVFEIAAEQETPIFNGRRKENGRPKAKFNQYLAPV